MTHASKGHTRRTRLGTIEREVLEELSVGDLLVGFLCSARSTRRMYKIARERAKHRYHTRLAIERLTSEGHISRSGEFLSINTSGRRLLRPQRTFALRSERKNGTASGALLPLTFPSDCENQE